MNSINMPERENPEKFNHDNGDSAEQETATPEVVDLNPKPKIRVDPEKVPRFNFEEAAEIDAAMKPISEAVYGISAGQFALGDPAMQEYLATLQKYSAVLGMALGNELTARTAIRNLRALAKVSDYAASSRPYDNGFAKLGLDETLRLAPKLEEYLRDAAGADMHMVLELYYALVDHGSDSQKNEGAHLLYLHRNEIWSLMHSEKAFMAYWRMFREMANFGNANEAGVAIRKMMDFCRENIRSAAYFHHLVCDLLEVKRDGEGALAAGEVLGEFLKEHQLPDRTLAVWAQSTSMDDFSRAIFKNTEHILLLEAEQPGVCKFLNEHFGIYDFGRYPVEMLMRQYQEFDDNSKPYGVVMYPLDDHNGAFYQDVGKFHGLFQQLDGEFYLRVSECESKMDIARTLVMLDKKYNVPGGHKIELLILGGHGSEDSITFGGSDARHRLTIADLVGTGVRKTGGFFADEPTFILASSSTGADGGIAQELSKVFGAKVIAPKIPTNVRAYYGSRNRGQDKFRFNARYMDEESGNTYVTGKLAEQNR